MSQNLSNYFYNNVSCDFDICGVDTTVVPALYVCVLLCSKALLSSIAHDEDLTDTTVMILEMILVSNHRCPYLIGMLDISVTYKKKGFTLAAFPDAT